jgi:hypothetical protein
MKHPITGLFSVDAIYEAVASFDVATMSMHFSHQYLISEEDASNLPREGADARFLTAMHVPTPILAHEICHIWETATTPTGLRDFSSLFAAEFVVRDALTEAARIVGGRLPVGLHHLLDRNNISSDLGFAYEQVLKAYNNIAFRNGGLRVPVDLLNETGSSERFKDCHFFITSEDAASKTRTLLGARHIHEGFANAVEFLRISRDRIATLGEFPPFDPYLICNSIYMNRRGKAGPQIRNPLLEQAVILDTALMVDQWMTGDDFIKSTPAHSFFLLLDSLANSPELKLNGNSDEQIAQFQDELLSSIGLRTSVSAICSSLLDYIPTLLEEVRGISSIPRGLIEIYGNSIQRLLRFRLEAFGGACPIRFLVYAPRQSLEMLLEAVPVTTTAAIIPVTEDNQDSDLQEMFNFQAAGHLRPVVEELVFGTRPCPVADRCILPRRPACRGVTQQLVPPGDRCARESVISSVLSDLQINELIFD